MFLRAFKSFLNLHFFQKHKEKWTAIIRFPQKKKVGEGYEGRKKPPKLLQDKISKSGCMMNCVLRILLQLLKN